ncbi:hypothetical protein RIF29_21817 [Crotalaria pallida]|uniref:Uncharacterized protein n=1 Tax=Crotalaria pallida TaxID=3830 RepID=A0AAN9F7J8_CROPI
MNTLTHHHHHPPPLFLHLFLFHFHNHRGHCLADEMGISNPLPLLSSSLTLPPHLPLSLSLSLSLKSGLGLFGSPRHSPLLFSVNFSIPPSPSSFYNPVPTFLLHFKPQLDTKPVPIDNNNNTHNNGEIEKGFVGDGSSSAAWRELKLEPFGGIERGSNNHVGNSDDVGNRFFPERLLVVNNKEKCGLLPGAAVMARTVLPVTKGLTLSLR